MRTFKTIAAAAALATAAGCSEPPVECQDAGSGENSAAQSDSVPTDAASSSAVYLSCSTDDDSAPELAVTYRIDPVERTWSWWIEAETDGGPDWRVIHCPNDDGACEFSETVYDLYAGMGMGGRVRVNRLTGGMTRRKFSSADGLQEWAYTCTPTKNPVDAYSKKF